MLFMFLMLVKKVIDDPFIKKARQDHKTAFIAFMKWKHLGFFFSFLPAKWIDNDYKIVASAMKWFSWSSSNWQKIPWRAGEIIESSGGLRYLSTILLKIFHLFKITESVINFHLKFFLTNNFKHVKVFLVEWWTTSLIHHVNLIISRGGDI